MDDDFDEDAEAEGLFQRRPGLVIFIIILVLAPILYFGARALKGGHSSTHSEETVDISVPPPPPPATPRPRPTPTPELQTPPPEQVPDKMVQQAPVQEEKKEKAPDNKPPDQPAPLGTNIAGPGGGPDLGLGRGSGGLGGGGSGNGGGGSKYGWYAGEVQSRIADAVRNNAVTRNARVNIVIRIWPDATGRIVKVRLSGSTGDKSVDDALQDSVLTGLQLKDPPPSDMPLPIVMRLSEQRPE